MLITIMRWQRWRSIGPSAEKGFAFGREDG